MKLSIVTTLYKSQEYLIDFYVRIIVCAQKITEEFEIIFVDDGSPDNSNLLVRELTLKDSRVKLVELSRNYGHHPAMMCGLSYASGEKVFLIDCDLEEPPELLGQFNQLMEDNGVDVVYGVQESRKGKFFERLSGTVFYKLINLMSSVKVPNNVLTVRLMTKKFIKALDGFQERVVFAHGIWASLGFKQLGCPVAKTDKGETCYSLGKKLKLAVDSITSFSAKPLSYVFGLGAVTSLISMVYFIIIIIKALFYHAAVVGWSSLIASIWLFGGLTLLSVGIVGAYVGRIFIEVKGRPRAVVRSIYQKPGKNSENMEQENYLKLHAEGVK